MIKSGCVAILAALAMPMAPVAAQDSVRQGGAETAEVDEIAPEDDLDCALLAAIASGQLEDNDQKLGVVALMAYILGRYEQATNHDMGIAMAQRLTELRLAELANFEGKCLPRMQAMADRLKSMSGTFEELKAQSGE